MLTIIAAAAENNVLSKDNRLVWHLPDDFRRFKKLTTGHHIIMGRKTFETFPKLLPKRTHVVITRDKSYQPKLTSTKSEKVIIVHSLEAALEIASDDPQPFVIGGGEIYKQSLPRAEKIELTRVHGSPEGDTFFPEMDEKEWKLLCEEFYDKDERHEYPFTYLTYIRE